MTELGPSEFLVVTGRRKHVAHEQYYANGTVIITIKRAE